MARQIAVIGIGRFGESLCMDLMRQGAQVLAVDRVEQAVEKVADRVTRAAIGDVTDERVVQELGLQNMDAVFVAIGEDTSSSILVTLMLKDAGVDNLWVKAGDRHHHAILKKIGADRVVNPEMEMSARLSRQLLTHRVYDYLDLDDQLAIVEVQIPPEIEGWRLEQIQHRKDVRLLALKREASLIVGMKDEEALQRGDVLILGGSYAALNKLLQHL